MNKSFLLNWKKTFLMMALWFVFVILHNLIYAVFKAEEAFFFILAIFVLPLYFIIALIYTIIKRFKNEKDINNV